MGEDSTADGGKNGIRSGDGFHDYLIAGFVSCNHTGLIPVGKTIATAQLRMRPSRVFGTNPFTTMGARLVTDMVCSLRE